MEMDYTKLKLHPLFEPIKRLFEFFILGVGFIGMPEFQTTFLRVHPGMLPLITDFNKQVDLRIDGANIKASTKLYLISIGRFMAIAIFDFLLFSKYNQDLSRTEIFRFVKHIRNGAAHNNRFTFKGKDPTKKLAKWQNKIIDQSLVGKPVIPDFINPIELLYLMSDLSDLIAKKESLAKLK